MGLFTRDIKTMDDLFLHTLQDIYYAEKQITKALPKMIQKAGSQELKRSFETHLRETETHVSRLENVFRSIGEQPKGVTCEAIDGIISEADSVIGNVADQDVLDAAMISAAQAVEHYEITRYGTLIAWAQELGHGEATQMLRQTLDEEKATDVKLSKLAESRLNRKAAA